MERARILIVEDEWIVAEDLQTTLTGLGYEVTGVVASGEEAVLAAAGDLPDLVLMDIVLQGEIDGIEAAGQIHDRLDVPVIYLSAYSNEQLLEQAKRTGPFGYLIKPFQEKGLHTTIEMALFKHKMEMELKDRLQQQVSERERAEGAVRAFLRERDVLLEEIHQGLRNSMQIVAGLLDSDSGTLYDKGAGILEIHSGYVKSKPQVDVLAECRNRIMCVALAVGQVYRAQAAGKMQLEDYLRELVRNLYRSYGVGTDEISIEIDAGGAFFEVDTAIPCGLIVNELVSNSLRHAFPDERRGRIEIAVLSAAEGEFELAVRDNGIGLPADIDLENIDTLGLAMVVAFAEGELLGRIELDSSQGTEFRIRFNPGRTRHAHGGLH